MRFKEKAKVDASIIIALIITVFIHLILVIYAPMLWSLLFQSQPLQNKAITLTIESFPSKDPYFVETNINAPETEPNPESPFISDHSTIASQPIPSSNPSSDPLPSLNEDLEDSLKFIQGSLQSPLSPPSPEELIAQETDSQNQSTEKSEQTPFSLNPTNHSIPQEKSPSPQLPKPRPRPQLDRSTIGPLAKNKYSSSKIGPISVDAHFSEYGDYIARMLEAIHYQWQLLVNNYAYSSKDHRSRVVIKFELLPSGEIRNVTIADSTTSELSEIIAKDAILSVSPFNPWTHEMLTTLGKFQTITIGFYY